MVTKARKGLLADLEALTRSKDYIPQSAGLKQGSSGEDVFRLQAYLSKFVPGRCHLLKLFARWRLSSLSHLPTICCVLAKVRNL